MQVSEERINKAIRKLRFEKAKKYIFFVLLFIVVNVVFVLPNLSVGSGEEVIAYVENTGISYGANGDSIYIVCRLPDATLINIFPPSSFRFKVGDGVILKAKDRLIGLGPKKYTFVGPLTKKE